MGEEARVCLKAQTKKVILRTQETLWEEQRVWARGGFFMPVSQGRLHLTSGSSPGIGECKDRRGLGPRGETQRRRKSTLGSSGTRDVGGLGQPELYNLEGHFCFCGCRIQCEVKALDGAEVLEGP